MTIKLKNSDLLSRLQNAYQVCKECGRFFGEYSVGCSSSWIGDCDVCGMNASVTEARDYGYLKKGIDELRGCIKTQSKKVAEYMTELEKQTKYSTKITQVTVERDDSVAVVGTIVALEDEGGGPFLVINAEGGEIRLDLDEFDEIIKAVQLLKNQ